MVIFLVGGGNMMGIFFWLNVFTFYFDSSGCGGGGGCGMMQMVFFIMHGGRLETSRYKNANNKDKYQ